MLYLSFIESIRLQSFFACSSKPTFRSTAEDLYCFTSSSYRDSICDFWCFLLDEDDLFRFFSFLSGEDFYDFLLLFLCLREDEGDLLDSFFEVFDLLRWRRLWWVDSSVESCRGNGGKLMNDLFAVDDCSIVYCESWDSDGCYLIIAVVTTLFVSRACYIWLKGFWSNKFYTC